MASSAYFSHRNVLQAALTGLAVVALVVLAQQPQQPASGSPTAPPSSDLRSLFEQFQAVTSMQLSANVEILLTEQFAEALTESDAPLPAAAVNQPFTGRFEFLACGDRYRVQSLADSAYPGALSSAAYDGHEFQMQMGGDLNMARAGDVNTALPGFPHPLLQLLQFCYPVTDATYAWEVRLKDVTSDTLAAGFWEVPWTDVEADGLALEEAIFPGGDYEGRTYVHRVVTPRGERNRPCRIDRVAADGHLLTSASFSDYRPADQGQASAWWPRRVVLEAFNAEGLPAGRLSYEITTLAIDVPMSSDLFVLPAE